MLPKRIFLVDKWQSLVRAWSEAFDSCDMINVSEGDFFAQEADAMVSPANSFGIMDGGLDVAIRSALGHSIQTAVQAVILEKYPVRYQWALPKSFQRGT